MKVAIIQCDPPPIIRTNIATTRVEVAISAVVIPSHRPPPRKSSPRGADLNHAQHRTEGDGLRRRQALRFQELDHGGAESEGDESAQYGRSHDQVERAFPDDVGLGRQT
jgi:hypothetical protein